MKVDSYMIAKVVGVSQATVSRAFSRPDKVSPATRQKIMEAAESMGYKLDKNASALRRKGTNTIMLLYVKREDGHYWTNIKRNYWIFSEALLTLTNYFEEQPYFFEIKQVSSIYSISAKDVKAHCDGIMIFDFVTAEESRYIDSWEIPYVICHRAAHLKDVNFSATDNFRGGVIQAEYLKSRDCANPVYITYSEDPFSHKLREQGFRSIYPECRIYNRDEQSDWFDQLFMDIQKKSIDGLASVNDMHLVRTLTSLFKRQINLQDHCPVIGYDNSTELLVLEKKPASIEIGISYIYREAAEALLKLIDGSTDTIRLVHAPELCP